MPWRRAGAVTAAADKPAAATILLVEDETAIRRLIAAMLEGEGYRVIEAADGLQAVDLFDERVDLLLTDIRLPHMDGHALMRELRRRRRTLKVLAISAHELSAATEPDVVFLPKPFTSDQLLAKIAMLNV